MQVESLTLEQNQLVGTLPESWGSLSSVSRLPESVHLLLVSA